MEEVQSKSMVLKASYVSMDVLVTGGVLAGVFAAMSGRHFIFGWYALVLLYVALIVSAFHVSRYGTVDLNKYRKIGWISVFVSTVILVKLFFDGAGGVSESWLRMFLLYILPIVCLLLVRGIGSSMKRLERYPVLTGCSLMLVGDDERANLFRTSIPVKEKRGLHIVCFNPKVENPVGDMQKLIEDRFIQMVVFLQDEPEEKLMDLCKVQGIRFGKLPVNDSAKGDTWPCVQFKNQMPDDSLLQFSFNRLSALLLLIATLPVWIIAIACIKMASPGPAFYRQERSGNYGKHFSMLKFRTMYMDADKKLDEIKEKYGNDMSGPIFKLENDPRIFPLGCVFRKLSIDELPQLVNVLAGDMNLVGPRPLPVYETEAFDKVEYRKRLSVLPGMTCYWQIEGRSDISDFDELIQLDYKYIQRKSFWTDVAIILRTLPAVLLGRGAK